MERFKQPENRDEVFYDEMAHVYSVVYGKRKDIFEDTESVIHHLFIYKKQDLDKFLQSATKEEVEKVKEYAEFHDFLMIIRTKNSLPEEIEKVYTEMQSNDKLKNYIDKRLPSCLVEDYVHWILETRDLPEDLSQLKDNGETYKDEFERFSLSDYQIKKLFNYVGDRDKEIKEGFEEQYGTVIGPQDGGSHQVKELEVKSRAWEEYKEFQDLVNYLKGNIDADLEDNINNKLIEDKNFRMFFVVA
jgi:hypothetical protein